MDVRSLSAAADPRGWLGSVSPVAELRVVVLSRASELRHRAPGGSATSSLRGRAV